MAISVSGPEELQAALAIVTAGETIILAPGDYGEIHLGGLNFDPPVTITSADPDDMAVIGKINMIGCDGLVLDQLMVDFVPDMETTYNDSSIRIVDCANITISNSVLQGGDSINGIDPESEPGTPAPNGVLGYPTAKGITINGGTDITITDTEIADFGRGITFGNVDGFNVMNNYIHDTRGSPLTGGGNTADVLIEGNHFSSADAWNLGGAGDHGDFIHIFSTTKTTEPHDNIVIRDNFFEQGDGQPILGIYLDDNGLNQGFTNVVIEDNLLHNGDTQGMRLENVDGALIQNNTLLPTTTDGSREPGIVITGGSSDIQLVNNVLSGIYGTDWDNAASNNITGTGNLYVQNGDIHGENYVGDLYVNSQIIDGDLRDFVVVPTSAADGKGASFTQWGALQGETVGYISDAAWSGLDMKVHTFEMALLIGPEGPVDLNGATVSWDFGDGTTGTGASINHEFDLIGHYKVTATIKTADGQTLTVEKAVNVQTADALSASFENTFSDLSEIETPFEIIGSADFVESDYGLALSLGSASSAVLYEGTGEMTGNPEYSMSISFCKEALDDSGRLMYFSGTGVLIAGEDSLYFTAETDTGDVIKLNAGELEINDTEWHHVTMTYSGNTGTATLYLDGEAVDEQTGLTGGQYTPNGQDLAVGGRFGGSFTGLMDNVEFARGALSAEDVAELHGTLMGVVIEPPVEEPPSNEPPVLEPTAEDPPAEESPVEEPPAEDEPDNPRGAPRDPVEREASSNFMSKILDIFLSIFGLGSDKSVPTSTIKAAAEVFETTALSDIVPLTDPLDETLPEDYDDEIFEENIAA